MKITVLGSGSAFGLPMVFNVWGKANPNNPKNKRTRASLLLEEDGKSILIDAGPDFRNQINDNNIKNIDAVFITHCHYDHMGGVPELPRAAKILGHRINIFAAQGAMTELEQSYGYLFSKHTDSEPDKASLNWQLLPNEGTFAAEGLEFKTMLFKHHNIFSSAFRHKNFAYVTDWEALPENCDAFFTGLDLLIIECNNADTPEVNGHSDIFQIKDLIAKYAPKHVVLSHISRRVDADEFSKTLPDGCELSYDGMVLNV